MIKGGTYPSTVQGSVRYYMQRGYSFSEAITEVEKILRGKLPPELVDRIRGELE